MAHYGAIMTTQFGRLAATAAMAALCSAPPAIARQAPLPIDAAVSSPAAAGRDSSAPDAHYRLQRGDVVELNFPFVPTFNQTLTIQPDGYVTLHALRPLQVDGLTVAELTEKLRSEYVSVLRDPVITVLLKDFEKPYFIVSGEVEKPGKYICAGRPPSPRPWPSRAGFGIARSSLEPWCSGASPREDSKPQPSI